ncbi:MAG: response regulator transcription factor [Lachnospiraceae bacterium]|nr:response regulator transcription factor [Lachnospiraceae bacterium]
MSFEIMIADDHPLFREGLRYLLETEKCMHVAAMAQCGAQCLELLEKEKPDLLLLDIDMPDKNGIETLSEIKNGKYRKIKVLMLTAHREAEYVRRAVCAGADGYISKTADLKELLRAIHIVSEGKFYIQPDLEKNTDFNLTDEEEKILSLSGREREVLAKVADGMSNKEISTVLHISEKTVKNHLSCIFKKMEVSDRTQAAIMALRHTSIFCD